MWRGLRVYSGICPDPECHTKLYFPSYASSSVECTGCGQHHAKDSLLNVEDIQDPDVALRSLLRSVLLGQTSSKTTPDLVKVKGYSNYHCKLLSPLLTHYGMDKRTGEGKLLSEMGQGEVFDCAVLGDRAFQIESEHTETAGYGRDKTGSEMYLKNTLEAIKLANDNEERLVPVHVDGDGHCLVHAISRALVGREIFWHALRANLKNHLKTELHKYKGLFRDFIHDDEWKDIISEADPYFQPPDGEGLGLRNIHLFGLANVLHRPIILLDNVSGMQSSGDYTGIFLPALVSVDKCKRDNVLNKPLTVAWSSSGRNHFIPLVGVKGKPVPKLPQWLIPKAWGIPNEVVKQYVEFDSQGHCFIGGERCLQEKYLQRLVKAMDDLFMKKYSIAAQLVTEVHQFVYKPSGMVGVKPETVTRAAKSAVTDGRLYRCLSCNALSELHVDFSSEMLQPGGDLYNIAVQSHGPLAEGLSYSFPAYELVCVFDAERNTLVAVKHKNVTLLECHLCHGPLRRAKSDGSAVYTNGDRTTTPVEGRSRCGCGFKHYWNGREYDNMPESFPISLEWGGKTVSETVYWFQYEQDPSLNSNVYDVAAKLVQKHFPGEFGSERLVQKVVDIILRQTAKREGENKGARPDFVPQSTHATNVDQDPNAAGPFMPSKIILMGEKKKTLHKEELTMSETERVLKTRTEHHAAIMQKRRSGEGVKKTVDKEAKVPKQQPVVKPQPTSPQTSPGKHDDNQVSPTQPAVKRTDKKVRLSTSDGKQCMITLAVDTTFKQLQDLIEKELGIPSEELRIRCGFPPRELHPPDDGHEEEPVPLQHGERVMVEHLKPVVPEEQPPDVVMSELKDQGDEGNASSETSGSAAEAKTNQQRQAQNTAAMTSVLFNALGALAGGDMWEAAQNCHEMFDKGGFYYNKVANDLGPLQPNQHCTLPFFPNKVFAYNAEKDRLDLCLGQRHIQVQPLDDETLRLAHSRPAQVPADERASSLSSEASFSGAIGHRGTLHSRIAFSGEGRTLSNVQSPSSGIQLSGRRSPQTAKDSSMDTTGKDESVEDQGKESKNVDQETSPSKSMVTEQVGLKTEENIQEMHVPELVTAIPVPQTQVTDPVPEMPAGDPVSVSVTQTAAKMGETQLPVEQTAQFEASTSVTTEAASIVVTENESMDVKLAENVQERFVESPVPMLEETITEPLVEETATTKEGEGIQTGVASVMTMENENMETNQDPNKHYVADNDSTNLTEQGDKVEDYSEKSTEITSESMETDQATDTEDCVTQQVTQGMSGNQTSKANVMESDVKDTVVDVKQSDGTVECSGLEPSDEAVMHTPVAMEMDIDNKGESSKSNSELTSSEMPPGHDHLSGISQNVESSQTLNSRDASDVIRDTTPMLAMDNRPTAEHDTSEALGDTENKSTKDGVSDTPTADT